MTEQTTQPIETPASTGDEQKMNPMLLIGVVALIVIGGGAYLLGGKPAPSTDTNVNVTQELAESSPATIAGESAMGTESAKAGDAVKIDAENFSYSVKEIKVKKGDTVTIVVTNKEGTHDFVLDEFNVKTKMLSTGASETVTFTASQAGTFEYYCSVGSHRKMGMLGKLIVE